MKKNKLDSKYTVDFELFGVVCNKKEYKLAWHINEEMNVSLKKQEDVKIEYANNTAILISNYTYETEFLKIELLQNKLAGGGDIKNQLLIPELKQFDYLIKFKDQTGELTSEIVNVTIKGIPVIEYVMQLNFDSLKSKENLMY